MLSEFRRGKEDDEEDNAEEDTEEDDEADICYECGKSIDVIANSRDNRPEYG